MRHAVFRSAIRDAFWLPDADVLIRGTSEMPDDAVRAAEALGLELDDAFAAVCHEWGKVETEVRERIGTAGEQAVLALLAEFDGLWVEHVAAYSDGHGFDIAIEGSGLCGHLEVKATTRRGRLTIYLSRNEYEAMLRDPAWTLIAVRLDQDLCPAALATVDRNWINAVAPADRGSGARWASVRLDVPPGALRSGIHGMAGNLPMPRPRILDGVPAWPG